MLNQSADYAVRAVLFMAQHDDGGWCSADMVAEAIGVPRNYLGKILRVLARTGTLDSVRGPKGGFRLATPPGSLTLAEIVSPFQKMPGRQMCLLGKRRCDPANPCGAHQQWQVTTDRITEFFRMTTVASLLNGDAAVPAGGVPSAANLTSTRSA